MNTECLSLDRTINQDALLPINYEEARDYIVIRAQRITEELIRNRNRNEPPFTAREYAQLLNVKIEHVDIGDTDAILLKLGKEYVIKMNKNRHVDRQNFSCAHEIGHIFLHELNRPFEVEEDEFRIGNSQAIYKSKERLCDIAAAELLMPRQIFYKYLEGFGLTIYSIERLAKAFKISIQAAAIRIAQVSSEPCYAILWRQCHMKRSKGFKGYLDRKSLYIRNPSPISKAFESDKPVKSYKSFEIDNAKKRCWMESKAFGYGNNKFVISLVLPDRKGK